MKSGRMLRRGKSLMGKSDSICIYDLYISVLGA